MRDFITLSMTSFKRMLGRENAEAFFGLLDRFGGIYTPDLVSDSIKYKPGATSRVLKVWKPDGLLLRRKRPVSTTTTLFLTEDSNRKRNPNNLHMTVGMAYFDSPKELANFRTFGTELYELMSSAYGVISIPWLPRPGSTARLEWGFPGFGWTTWIGPEYEHLIEIPDIPGVSIERLSDGGRAVTLASPKDPRIPDEKLISAAIQLNEHVPTDVRQPSTKMYYDLSHIEPPEERFTELGRLIVKHAKDVEEAKEKISHLRLPRFRFVDS